MYLKNFLHYKLYLVTDLSVHHHECKTRTTFEKPFILMYPLSLLTCLPLPTELTRERKSEWVQGCKSRVWTVYLLLLTLSIRSSQIPSLPLRPHWNVGILIVLFPVLINGIRLDNDIKLTI